MLAVGLLYTAFIILKFASSIPRFSRIFRMNAFWILSKTFSACNKIIKWSLSLNLVRWWISFIDLHYPCISGMKWTWTLQMKFLMCSWNWFVFIYWEFIHLCLFETLSYKSFFLLLLSVSGFSIGIILTLKMNLESLSSFLEEFCVDSVHSRILLSGRIYCIYLIGCYVII